MLNQNGVTPIRDMHPPDDVYFGQSLAMQGVRRKIAKVANTDLPLLIQGDNGTGKEVLSRMVHARSVWSNGAFVKVNCAAIPGTLMESELFGYEKGAFTGAYASKTGRVEMAHGGTLFLDEIGELDLSLQAKLLQFLQDGRFCRIGDQEEKCVETRVICATSRKLEEEVQAGTFRTDLFYRINVIYVKLPPLRERRADIPLLANYLLSACSAQFQQALPVLSSEILEVLQRCDWPGNIRELENCMARCVLLGPEEALGTYFRENRLRSPAAELQQGHSLPLKRISEKARRELERDLILKTLEIHNWNRRKAAEALQISYRTLLYKVREAGLSTVRPRRDICLPKESAAAAGASSD